MSFGCYSNTLFCLICVNGRGYNKNLSSPRALDNTNSSVLASSPDSWFKFLSTDINELTFPIMKK